MPRPAPRTLALLATGLLLPTLTAVSCGEAPSAVALGAAATGTVDEVVEAPGTVTARAAATVRSPADGTVDTLRVDAGDRVSRGQVVAVIDAPAVRQRLTDAERALDQVARPAPALTDLAGVTAVRHRTDAQADAAFTAARTAAGRVTDPALRAVLLHQVTAAQHQYRAAAQAADAALRSVQDGLAGLGAAVGALGAAQRLQAEQAYQLADAAVDALTLRAPVSGVVQFGGSPAAATPSLTGLLSGGAGTAGAAGAATGGAVTSPGVDAAVVAGAAVTAGAPVLTIVDTGRLGLTAEVDETDVLLVKEGGTATVELDAAPGATYRATVRAIDLLPTTSARGGVSYRVRLALAGGRDADGATAPTPRPGMSAVVRLRVRQASDAVTVPASAVLSVDGRDTVWSVQDGRAQRIPVTLGVQGEDVVQVVSGITAGQRIVVAGADQVSAGQEVQ